MASAGKNLSRENLFSVSNPSKLKIGIIVSQWNDKITQRLLKGAEKALENSKILSENIIVKYVPGTFELPLGAQYLFEKNLVDGIICIGCVIQGETKHFDYVCQGATNGIMNVGLRYNKPTTFCVLTDQNEQQSNYPLLLNLLQKHLHCNLHEALMLEHLFRYQRCHYYVKP